MSLGTARQLSVVLLHWRTHDHSGGHRFFNRSSEATHSYTHSPLSLLYQETAAFLSERIVISCVKEKAMWKMELVPHESSVRSSGWCLLRVSVFIGNKHLMMVLHSSELNQWVKTLCSITLFLGVSSILSASADILHCLK